MTTPKQTPISSGELMIWNWVQNQYGMTMQVHTINTMEVKGKASEQVTNLCIWNKDIYGIALTKELIEKVGFKYLRPRIGTKWYYGLNGVNVMLSYGDIFYRKINHPVYCLHTLQNLYHSLTGSHLKVEL